MSRKLTEHSAYHGGSWQLRIQSHQRECDQKKHWSFTGLNSEFASLKKVILCKPSRMAINTRQAEKLQLLRPLDWKILQSEFRKLKKTIQQFGIEVVELDSDAFKNPGANLIFVRDHAFMTPWGCVIGRMASPVRAGEEKWSQKLFADQGIPILKMIRGNGLFEGADALWANSKTVIIGVGNRTNNHGALQVSQLLREYGVSTIKIKLPKQTQHLLGIIQFVAKKTVLVRVKLAPKKLITWLLANDFEIIEVGESEEVTQQMGMNFLTVAAKKVIMPSDCPELRQSLSRQGIKVVAEVKISQYLNAAGGIGCATHPVARQSVK